MNASSRAPARQAQPVARPMAGSRQDQGFSILEVLIALIVTAILALGVLTAQYQSFRLAQGSKSIWENLNFAQEFLARRYPANLKEPTPGTVDWREGNIEGANFGVAALQPLDGVRWFTLRTGLKGSQLTWEWPTRASGEAIGNWAIKQSMENRQGKSDSKKPGSGAGTTRPTNSGSSGSTGSTSGQTSGQTPGATPGTASGQSSGQAGFGKR